MEDAKHTCAECQICAELKPRFFKPPSGRLIHSRPPFERLSIDFMGPKPSTNNLKYLLVIVDEYSRYPFVYPCQDISTKTVINCLQNLFTFFGCPDSIHSDRGSQFISCELKEFLWQHGVVITHSTPYHPIGNGQCERVNGTIWKTIKLALKTRQLDERHWHEVLDIALHSIRSLLCTATNSTPHERMFNFSRRSGTGYTLPEWLQGGPALLRKFVRLRKSDPLLEPVDIISATPNFARIRFPDGRQSTVSTEDLVPTPVTDPSSTNLESPVSPDHGTSPDSTTPSNIREPELIDQQETPKNNTSPNGESFSSVDKTKCLEIEEQQQQSDSKKGVFKFLPEATKRGRKITCNPKYK